MMRASGLCVKLPVNHVQPKIAGGMAGVESEIDAVSTSAAGLKAGAA